MVSPISIPFPIPRSRGQTGAPLRKALKPALLFGEAHEEAEPDDVPDFSLTHGAPGNLEYSGDSYTAHREYDQDPRKSIPITCAVCVHLWREGGRGHSLMTAGSMPCVVYEEGPRNWDEHRGECPSGREDPVWTASNTGKLAPGYGAATWKPVVLPTASGWEVDQDSQKARDTLPEALHWENDDTLHWAPGRDFCRSDDSGSAPS
ncbi:unnamed protein product [Trypanosoma congolense IL3000]|uniref:WGS project CAEQ00000000 data, annotated contig 423 n=1 Tax=Trypanosoma congolense (strain IL3000) TaxID=1068625 RepID=F9WFT2_TRYCI|nr:unnamed protein product [Trypanosoma congolense IL3000]